MSEEKPTKNEETLETDEEHEELHDLPLVETFIILAVLTIIEVLLGELSSGTLTVVLLILLAIVKATLVAAVFMEIAFSKEVTKVVISVFIIPLIAVIILIATIGVDWRTPIIN